MLGDMSTLGGRIAQALQKKNGGNQSELARYVGVTPQAVQQWISGETSPRGKRLARIADFLGVSPVALQYGEGYAAPDQLPAGAVAEAAGPYRAAVLQVPVLNVEGSMGAGRLAPAHESVVDFMRLSEQWLRRNLVVSSLQALRVVTAYGDSMDPTFTDGDLLLADTGVTEIKIDAVYVIGRGDELFIKRVQRRLDGAVIIKSDNPLYESYVVPPGEADQLRVLARVVWAWNGKKL